MRNVHEILLDIEIEASKNISWAAYHAHCYQRKDITDKTALSTVGDWLKGSGWTSVLVQADVTTPGTADSFLKVSHTTHTRRAHQISLTSLFILKKRAYENYRLTLEENKVAVSFEPWCKERASRSPHFRYWEIVMEWNLVFLHLCVLCEKGTLICILML